MSAPSDSKIHPLAPVIHVSKTSNEEYLITLSWSGSSPGRKTATVNEESILKSVHDIAQSFSKTYPKEKTLQVSMDRLVKYQVLISLMDGAKEFLPDIVLSSYEGKSP